MTNDNIPLADSNGLPLIDAEVQRDENWYNLENDSELFFSGGSWGMGFANT